jgi:ribonuclease E
MSKQIVIAEQHRIAAVFDAEQIQELVVATGTHQVSDIYLGVVENVLPGIDAAFVNIGDSDRNGFIHVTDLGPLRLRRSAASITELLAPQQKVLVQVMKEPTGTKGPRLTGNISLPGRYLVLMPYGRGVNLSRRIGSENERNRLRALAVLMKPAGMGVLVRTEADGMPEDAIIEDLENLQKQWESVLAEAANTRAPALLNRDDDFVQRVLRDAYNDDVNRIVVDSVQGLKRVKHHLTSWGGGRMPQGVLVDQHRERGSILEYFRVNAAIREAMKPRVDLPSGGYIIIEKTEALTVIDVNSGSFTRSATARETVLWTNCESATEIARQLRLRNIAGVIVVDFIDMESRRDKLQVLEHFNNAMRSDKAKPQIAQLTELGLVELTRKRQGKNIYELFGTPCTSCSGIGMHVHLPGEAPSALQTQHQYHHYEEIPDHFAPQPATPQYGEAPESRDSRGRGRGRSESRPPVSGAYREVYNPGSEALPGGFEEGYEGDGALDLSQHPSYQERGRGGNRRRRRRGEPFTKEVGGRSPSPWGEAPTDRAPLDRVPNDRISNDRISNDRPSVDRIPSRYDLPLIEEETEEVSDFQAEDALPIEKPERESRESRFEERRNRGRRDRTPSEPPEVIHVEMTGDEQDVYAWMGISPLILSSQTPKNPRSAVIKVYSPGEAPSPESLAVEAAEPEEFTLIESEFVAGSDFEESQPYARRQRGRIDRRSDGTVAPPIKRSAEMPMMESDYRNDRDDFESVAFNTEFQPEPARFEPEEAPLASQPSSELQADDSLDENGAPRRRRRRSSAT